MVINKGKRAIEEVSVILMLDFKNVIHKVDFPT